MSKAKDYTIIIRACDMSLSQQNVFDFVVHALETALTKDEKRPWGQQLAPEGLGIQTPDGLHSVILDI